ncbi:MAG: tRNA uridine-5-carboxymethylaminomethyl(34) synthesis GTPase MnmE [Desulfobacterales bacterium]|nr:MAG: tRNA uridine-5-carboxymethylaminomethyl(34) synthesis GTPase MnmE [Desulfobacterales bacterium]
MENSTIAAIATPGGRGGIGIIKLSGSKALSIASAIFSPANAEPQTRPGQPMHLNGRTGNGFKSHRLYYGHIYDPEKQRVLDEVLLSVMKAPRSYTREDVVEINAHGGQAAVNAILELVLRCGARLADPGEFTKRAFLNGRIDLTQAEAVIDIINARTAKSLRMAAGHVTGNLKRQVERIRAYLVELLTRTEAGIDFPDDVAEIVDPKTSAAEIQSNVIKPLQGLIQQHVEGNVLRDGLKVAVVGRPNVGKSSLLNCLVQKKRAIVTALPGTTRDTIEEHLNLKGFPIILADTAGLHTTDDPIEQIGIEKTMESIHHANLVLFMVEADCVLRAEDYKIFEQVKSRPTIIVINKIDLVNEENCLVIPEDWASFDCVRVSALYDRGISDLKEHIFEAAFGKNRIDIDEKIIPNLRQKLLIEDSLKAAEGIVRELTNGLPMELIAIHLQDAIEGLGQVLGTSVKVDVLDQIFSRFCIGK